MLDGDHLEDLAAAADVAAMEIDTSALSDHHVALVGYQRTKQINRPAREAWEAGDTGPVEALVAENREGILAGALLEIYREYLPLRDQLAEIGMKPDHVIDIGCGQALGDVFLDRDYAPRFTLIDIEETDAQYHGWASSGAGYASLDAAKAYLAKNGVAKKRIATLNPLKKPKALERLAGDLVISTYSCGFHYPVDDYADLMHATLAAGGAVCLDLRNKYRRRNSPALEALLEAGEVYTLYTQARSARVLIAG